MSDAVQDAWDDFYVDPEATVFTSAELRAAFGVGFVAGEQKNKPALELMSSLAINPAIPYEFRAMMRSSLGEPPLSPWEAPAK